MLVCVFALKRTSGFISKKGDGRRHVPVHRPVNAQLSRIRVQRIEWLFLHLVEYVTKAGGLVQISIDHPLFHGDMSIVVEYFM